MDTVFNVIVALSTALLLWVIPNGIRDWYRFGWCEATTATERLHLIRWILCVIAVACFIVWAAWPAYAAAYRALA